jgi:DNA-binding CsgD family transcriptional regulator
MPFHDFASAGIAMADGQWDDAAAMFDSGLELARESGSGWLSMAVGNRALIDVHRGQLAQAQARLDDFARRALPLQFGWDDPGLARLALTEARGDARSAAAQATRLWRAAFDRGGELWMASIAPYVARAGDEALRARMATDVERLPEGQMPGIDPVREQVRGTQARDVEAVTRAADRIAAADDVCGAAFAYEEAALLAATQGQMQHASRVLRLALDGYERLGATSDSERARRRAHALGLRPGGPQTRRQPRSGWDSLTPTETTIMELVRQGLTNPEIARRLFLSPRTVQTHVSHILQKTNLRSRVDIAAATAAR